MKLFEWDELNLIREEAVRMMALPQQERKKHSRQFCDYLEFVLCLVYAYGWRDAEKIVGTVPMRNGLDDKCVNLEIEHKTFRERVEEWLETGTAEDILRIIETESHRDYNTGVLEAGLESGQDLRKRWNTMKDECVRGTHGYIDDVVVGIEDEFYTYDGDHAMAPGGFMFPENNINCRCWITLQPA